MKEAVLICCISFWQFWFFRHSDLIFGFRSLQVVDSIISFMYHVKKILFNWSWQNFLMFWITCHNWNKEECVAFKINTVSDNQNFVCPKHTIQKTFIKLFNFSQNLFLCASQYYSILQPVFIHIWLPVSMFCLCKHGALPNRWWYFE